MTRSLGTLKYNVNAKHLMPKKRRFFSKFLSYMKRFWPLYLMMVPMIAYLFIFNYIPMAGLSLAFKDYNIRIGLWDSPWAKTNGELDLFKNFRTIFQDVDFWESFKITIKISALRLLIGFPIPIIITILLNEMSSKKFSKGFQIASYLPHFISWVVIYGILKTLVSSKSDFQNILSSIFGHEIGFLTEPGIFLFLVIFTNIWKEAGWSTIIYFAALAGINPELYEAADIDGASRWEKILHITLPGLVPAISINLILQASGFIYGGFDQIYAMTANGVNTAILPSVNIMEIYLFRMGISNFQYATATVVGFFNSLVSLVLILISNAIIKAIGGDGLW